MDNILTVAWYAVPACDLKIAGVDALADGLEGGIDGHYKVTGCWNGRPKYNRDNKKGSGAWPVSCQFSGVAICMHCLCKPQLLPGRQLALVRRADLDIECSGALSTRCLLEDAPATCMRLTPEGPGRGPSDRLTPE